MPRSSRSPLLLALTGLPSRAIGNAVPALLLSAVLAASVAPTAPAFADNLVVNGDFSDGLTGWTKVTLAGSPIIDVFTGSQCYAGQNGNPAATFNVFSGKKGALEQSISLPARGPLALTLREWGQLDPTTVNIIIFAEDGTPTVLETFTAERLIVSYEFPGPVFTCTGAGPITKSYDLSAWAGETIVLHIDATSTGFDGTFAIFDDVTIEGKTGVQGKVSYRPASDEAVGGATLHLTGMTAEGAAVDETTKTDSTGEYAFEVPKGSYTVEAVGEPIYVEKTGAIKDENGGVFSAETAEGGNCDGTATKTKCEVTLDGASVTADFSYTRCAADEKTPNGKPVTHCPIILVPGFLGSRIQCNGPEIWPGLPLPGWAKMQLQGDGVTNRQDNGDCNAVAGPGQGESGVVDSVAGSDIYRGALDFLQNEVPERWRAAPYDWRKSPVLGAEILKQAVDEALEATQSKHVVLYGHSMGGLVIREYLRSNADKVVRVVTAGTPYWGAPKSHFALLGGYTDTPAGAVLDYPTLAGDLQLLARNLQGLFFLYPSAQLGSWLSIASGVGKPLTVQGPSGEIEWIAALGATPGLLSNAVRWHAENDGFPETDVDYRVVVGSGTGTTHEIKVHVQAAPSLLDPSAVEAFGDIVIGNGDGTVPIRSATQGASDGGAPAGKNVPVYYACNVGHVALPVNGSVLDNIRYFLTGGEEITGLQTQCPYAGTQILFYTLDLGGGNTIDVSSSGGQSARSSAATARAGSMSLDDAVKQGLVQFLTVGRTAILLTDDAKPVTITVGGTAVAFQTRRFGSAGDGPLRSFKPVSGAVTIDASGQALSATGAKLSAVKGGGKAPKTKARLKKKNGIVTVKLIAKGKTGVAGTFYQVGDGGFTRYATAFQVTAGKTPVKVTYYSVDAFGVEEKPKKVKVRR